MRHVGKELILEFHLVCPDEVGFSLHAMALDGMAKGPGQRTTFDLALDHVVLCALRHSFGGQCFVVQSRQYDQRDVRSRRVRTLHRLQAMPIRQTHVQQSDVHATLRKVTLGFTHTQEVRQLETALLLTLEHFAEQADVSRVILNDKNLERLLFHERGSRGNLTTDNQKLSMLFTTSRNPSRPTGLVM